jgi:hypothetical protein
MVRHQTFGLKNISLPLNTAGWNMLLGEKLFGIWGPDKFWQFSGKKIDKIQGLSGDFREIVHVAERSFWIY